MFQFHIWISFSEIKDKSAYWFLNQHDKYRHSITYHLVTVFFTVQYTFICEIHANDVVKKLFSGSLTLWRLYFATDFFPPKLGFYNKKTFSKKEGRKAIEISEYPLIQPNHYLTTEDLKEKSMYWWICIKHGWGKGSEFSSAPIMRYYCAKRHSSRDLYFHATVLQKAASTWIHLIKLSFSENIKTTCDFSTSHVS